MADEGIIVELVAEPTPEQIEAAWNVYHTPELGTTPDEFVDNFLAPMMARREAAAFRAGMERAIKMIDAMDTPLVDRQYYRNNLLFALAAHDAAVAEMRERDGAKQE